MRCTACSRTRSTRALSGTNVARDFVEFPSQFNEHWALDPEVLRHYAVNYKTGAADAAGAGGQDQEVATWNQGYVAGRVARGRRTRHAVAHAAGRATGRQNVDAFETKALHDTAPTSRNVPPRYRSSYFLHIWANGYAAGYYAYHGP